MDFKEGTYIVLRRQKYNKHPYTYQEQKNFKFACPKCNSIPVVVKYNTTYTARCVVCNYKPRKRICRVYSPYRAVYLWNEVMYEVLIRKKKYYQRNKEVWRTYNATATTNRNIKKSQRAHSIINAITTNEY